MFGGVSDDLVALAKNILTELPPHSRDEATKNSLTAREFAERAKAEINFTVRHIPGCLVRSMYG